ncbi:hypothetical protein FOCC_FOCC011028 [Frankliniella occidentalis]|nr:hypothetical protein FOCC_FOCC011028 [Frankliniella occidentalis]
MSGKPVDVRDLPGVAVGIDLGTTYSVVAACRLGRVELLANDNGNRTTPSVVGFLEGQSFVGDAAKELPAINQVFDAKRLVGRQWSDLDIQKDMDVWPFLVVEQDGVPRIRVEADGKKETFAPEEDATRKLGVDLALDKQAVQDLRKACELAKRKLSTMPQATVSVFFPRLNKGYQTTISRALFEDLCSALFKMTIKVSKQVLADAKIYQGERSLVKDNFYLNKDITIEIPPKPVREATVDVTFEINESGLLTVTAVEPTSGRQVMVEVTPKEAHLSEADIQAMIQKASLYRCEDNEAKRKVEEELRKRGVVF